MPVKYVPYYPNTVEGQAILDNITRTQRVLRYRENDKVYDRIKRGMPYYEVEKIETVGGPSENLVIRGECISACAYLKEQGIKVDLVYIDPPFASGADYAKKVYLRRNPKLANDIAEIEQDLEDEELKSFEEKMYGDIWKKEDYLNWMYENLIGIRNIMSDTASIYLHIDYHIGHYVKILMDEVFGEDNFRNEIIWKRKQGSLGQTNQFGIVTDSIFFYSKSDVFKFTQPLSKEGQELYLERFKYTNEDGRKYRLSPLISPSYSPSLVYEYKGYKPPRNGWSVSLETMIRYEKEGRLNFPKDKNLRIERKQFLDEWEGSPIQNLWDDIHVINPMATEKIDYSTQKPKALLNRIINASGYEGMIVADFFGGSGVTAKVAYELGHTFVHCDVGINSIQAVSDGLKEAKANFEILEIKDGVSLFRNPQQTMDKLALLIPGLQKSISGINNFWFGAISESKNGIVPVYVPNLLNTQAKVLDVPLINTIINQELQNLEVNVKKVIVYYVDISDQNEIEKFIKQNNATEIEVELKDLKNLLSDVVIEDIIDLRTTPSTNGYETEITKFISDRLIQKINEFNQKGNLQSLAKGKSFNPINISEEGLELIELIALDCENDSGEWHSTTEIKIDKLGYVIKDGVKTKTFWDGKISSATKPKRLKVRNISGDETIKSLL